MKPVATVDLFPTLLEAAGLRPGPGGILDGTSLAGAIRGEPLPPRSLFWHDPLDRPHFLGGRSSGAILDGDPNLIEFFDHGAVEPYDLSADPGEGDLSARCPSRASELRDELAPWRRSLGAGMVVERFRRRLRSGRIAGILGGDARDGRRDMPHPLRRGPSCRGTSIRPRGRPPRPSGSSRISSMPDLEEPERDRFRHAFRPEKSSDHGNITDTFRGAT